MESTRKSIGMTFATQYLELSIQFAGVLILARLLTPAETGVYSVAAFLMVLLNMFRDFGVVNYVIQEHELSVDKIRSAFGVAILLALTVALAMYCSADLVAGFYDRPELKSIMHVMALSFAISPFGSLLFGIYRREMLFKKLLIIKISSALCHVAVATTLAFHGFGAISLAWANFAGILSFGIVANLFRPGGLPLLPRFSNIGTIMAFGVTASIGNVANAIGSNSHDVIIAKMIDMTSVGYFSRGNGLVQLFSRLIASALTPLTLPYFSNIKRRGSELREHYLVAISFLTLLSWPFFAFMALLAQPLVHILYGPQWQASVIVVQLLCIAGAINSMSIFASHAMIANGQVKFATIAQLVSQPIKVLAVIFGAGFGLWAVATALIVCELFSLAITNHFLRRTIQTKGSELLYACRQSLFVTACSSIGPFIFSRSTEWSTASDWLILSGGAATALFGWIAGVILSRHPIMRHIDELFTALGLPGHQRSGQPDIQNFLKQLCKFLVYQSGCAGLYHRWRNRNSLTVVMFHRVLPRLSEGDDPEWSMRCDTFLNCLDFFKKHYTVVTLEQVLAMEQSGVRLPPRSLLITFDDGWADTEQYALPLLEQAGVRGTIFVAGSAIGRPAPFWQEAVFALLSTDPDGCSQLNSALTEVGIDASFSLPSCDEAAVRSVIAGLNGTEPDRLARLAELLHNRSGARPFMLTAGQLQRLAVTQSIGAHGYSHQPLTSLAMPVDDVLAARRTLTLALGALPITALSFPHGAYNPAVLDACRQSQYRLLFSSDPVLNSNRPVAQNSPVLGRIAVSERDITDTRERFHPFMLAFWLFTRPLCQEMHRG